MDDGSLADYLYDNYGAEQDVDRLTFEKSIGYQEDRFWPALPNSIEQGLLAFTRGLENNLYSAGLMSTDTFVDLDILRTAQNQRLAQERFNQEEQEFLRNLDEESEHLTYEETFLNALERPDLIGGLLVESLTATAPGMAVAALGSVITAAATRNPDLATKVFWGLSGVAEGGLEYGAILGELFHEELGDQAGNPDAIRELLQDPEKMASFQSRAAAKGITVGTLNALLGFAGQRLATKLIEKTRASAKAKGDSRLKTTGKYVGIAGATAGVQAIGEGAIEALSQKAMGVEEINKLEVILESLGGAVMSPVELGMGAWTAHRDNWKKSIATAEQKYSKATPAQRNAVKALVARGDLPPEAYENMTDQEIIDYGIFILNSIEDDPFGGLKEDFLQRARSKDTIEAEIIKGQKGNKFWFELAQNKDADLVAGEVFDAEDIVNIGGTPAVVDILGRPLDTSEGVLSPEVKSILDTFAAQGLIKRERWTETGQETFRVTERGARAGPRGLRAFTAEEVSAYKALGLDRMPGIQGSLEADVMYAPENIREFLFWAEAVDKYIKGDAKALDGVIPSPKKGALQALHKEKHETNKKTLDDALAAAELAKTEAEQKAQAAEDEIREREWAAQEGMPTLDPITEETRQREYMGDAAYEEQQAADARVEAAVKRSLAANKGWETRRAQGWDASKAAEEQRLAQEREGKFSKKRDAQLTEAIKEVAASIGIPFRAMRDIWDQGLFVLPKAVEEIVKSKYITTKDLAAYIKRHKVKFKGKRTKANLASAALPLMEKEFAALEEISQISERQIPGSGVDFAAKGSIIELLDEMTARQLNQGDNIASSYTDEQKLAIVNWIQNLVGEDVTVRLEDVNELLVNRLNKRRDAGLTNDGETQILGYADPIEKVIVAALNPKYMNDVVGEEAFHIAQRLLLTDEELAILNDPSIDWIGIAEKNGIDLSAYEDNVEIKSFEAQAKIAARVANGKPVKNFMGPVRRVMTTLIRNMRKLANFVRGKGWAADLKTPQEIMLSFSRGEMSRRSKRMYPVGHSTSIDYDFAQVKRLKENFKNLTEGMASPDIAHQMGALSGAWQFWFNHPTAVAVKNVFFQPIANLAFKWSHAQNELMADAYKNADTFIKLTTKGPNALKNRTAVEGFVMALDFLGAQTPKKTNGIYSLTIPNPEALDAEGNPVSQKLFDRREWFRDQLKRQGWSVGQTLILNREQSQAYESFRKSVDVLKQHYREAIVRFFLKDIEGLETAEIAAARGVYSVRGLGNFIRYKETQHESAQIRQGEKSAAKIAEEIQILKNVRKLMALMDANPYYAPRVRRPGSAIVVKHVAEDGTETTVDVSAHVIPELVKGKQKIPFITGRAMDRMRQEQEYLKTIYPPDRYKVEIVEDFGIKNLDELKVGIQEGTVNVIEALQSNMGLEGSDDINILLSALSDLITKKEFGTWIKRQEQSITGHYRPGKFNEQTGQRMADEGWENQGSYLGPALNDYVQNMSFRIASTRFKPEIVEELKKLAASPKYSKQKAAHDYGTKWLEYVGDPKQKMSTLKSLAFHGFMGLNFSSAFLNLMQIPQALFPLLMAMAGGRVDHMWYIGVAFKDSMALIKRNGWKSLNTYGLDWAKPPKKWQNRDGTPNEEWLMLERLFAKGIAAPMNAQDLGAWLPPQFSSQRKLLRGVMDASGYFFGAAEFTNRMTSALSAYRMAKNNPAVLRRFGNYRKHTYFAEALTPEAERAEMTPEMAAEMAIMGSQYMMNKFNRPMVFHRLPGVGEFGPMESITQFMSFPWQYLEMWGTSFRMIKDKETRMMGLRMGLLMAATMAGLSGVMGMPFMENLRRIIRLLSDGDWDLEHEWKELMREAGVGELGEDIMFGGLPYVIPHFGVEGRYRFGQGSPVRDDILMGDFGAMLGPAYNFLSNSIGDLAQGIRSGKKWEIARALSPLAGVRNMFDTFTVMEEGMKTRNGTVHLTAAELTPANLFTKALGFSPAEYAARRNESAYAKYIGGKGDSVQEIETQALTTDYIAYINARRDGNLDRARDAYTDFSENYLEYMQEFMEDPEGMKPIHISTIKRRAMNAVFGPQSRYYFSSRVPTFRRPLLMQGPHALRAFRPD
jgi:hypothetical protein